MGSISYLVVNLTEGSLRISARKRGWHGKRRRWREEGEGEGTGVRVKEGMWCEVVSVV